MRNILVPTDFSDHSDNACQYALRLAAKLNARISLVHYFSDMLVDTEMPPENELVGSQRISEEILHATDQQAKASLEELHFKLSDQVRKEHISGVVIEHAFIWGNPETGISESCENETYDVIVMGTSGKGNNFFRGSVALKTIKEAPIPVLVIPPDSQFKEIGLILYATNFETADYQAVKRLCHLFAAFHPMVCCLHIAEDGTSPELVSKMDQLQQQLTIQCPDLKLSFEIVENKDIEEGLEEFLNEKQVAIIALMKHERNLLEKIFSQSVTKNILFHTKIPMLSFHT